MSGCLSHRDPLNHIDLNSNPGSNSTQVMRKSYKKAILSILFLLDSSNFCLTSACIMEAHTVQTMVCGHKGSFGGKKYLA